MSPAARRIRVRLPGHLRTLAHVDARELVLDVLDPVTPRAVLDALEVAHPVLRGTIRDPGDARRRPMVRLFACREDWSHADPDTPLPDAVIDGREPLFVIGAMAGG